MYSCKNHVQGRSLSQHHHHPLVTYFKLFGKFIWIDNSKMMANSFETPQQMQERARSLLLFWRRELERKLQINWYLLGCSRGPTLEIVEEMDRRPGDRQETLDYPKTFDNSDQNNRHTKSIRTQYHLMGPHPEAISQQLPETWPKYFGRGAPLKSES